MNKHARSSFIDGISVLSSPFERPSRIKRPENSVNRAWASVGMSMGQAISKESLAIGKNSPGKIKRKTTRTGRK